MCFQPLLCVRIERESALVCDLFSSNSLFVGQLYEDFFKTLSYLPIGTIYLGKPFDHLELAGNILFDISGVLLLSHSVQQLEQSSPTEK